MPQPECISSTSVPGRPHCTIAASPGFSKAVASRSPCPGHLLAHWYLFLVKWGLSWAPWVPLRPRQGRPTSLVSPPLHQVLPDVFTFELYLTHSGPFLQVPSGWAWELSEGGNHSEWKQCFTPLTMPFTLLQAGII